ncbi:hypothetical protein [Cytobacillus purgationiresistens]|uniref:Uncharacterized protein n=1 Tax=Cytobacillus purgationiresistens TaxID=863449 RepID=A0ABU0ACC7_9BACI|nr:hypothetical protein [Cytobacillus purgationiresistens]MDQ0268906.1 hypothetical protein [Cytobacillus purgationiresistens]
MNPIDELKEIVKTQKSISTKKLEEIVFKFEKMYIAQGKRIRTQQNSLSLLNVRYQREREKSLKRKEMVEQYENLKRHHRNLTREYNLLIEKYEETRAVKK